MLGAGEPLASTIESDWWSLDDDHEPSWYRGVGRRELLAVLPRVVSHRDRLLDAIGAMTATRPTFLSEPGDSFVWVQEAAMQRDLLRVAGDSGGAARWQAIIDRHARMLANRDRLIALDLWRRLSEQ